MITTAQKSPISASDNPNWFMRRASPNTDSIKNFALPGDMWIMVSLRIRSPFKQTRAYIEWIVSLLLFSSKTRQRKYISKSREMIKNIFSA